MKKNLKKLFFQSPYLSTKFSSYFDTYDKIFSRYINKKITFVEVGILNGGSLFMWRKYFGKKATIYRSTKKNKKYMIQDDKGHWVHFGQIPYQDFTKHLNVIRRKSYLNRSGKIRGNWRKKKYSANNLSRKILW